MEEKARPISVGAVLRSPSRTAERLRGGSSGHVLGGPGQEEREFVAVDRVGLRRALAEDGLDLDVDRAAELIESGSEPALQLYALDVASGSSRVRVLAMLGSAVVGVLAAVLMVATAMVAPPEHGLFAVALGLAVMALAAMVGKWGNTIDPYSTAAGRSLAADHERAIDLLKTHTHRVEMPKAAGALIDRALDAADDVQHTEVWSSDLLQHDRQVDMPAEVARIVDTLREIAARNAFTRGGYRQEQRAVIRSMTERVRALETYADSVLAAEKRYQQLLTTEAKDVHRAAVDELLATSTDPVILGHLRDLTVDSHAGMHGLSVANPSTETSRPWWRRLPRS